MPIFDFTHTPSGDTISVYVPANAPDKDRHEQVKDGKVYKRVYAAPLAAIDSQMGDGTMDDFRRKTTNKKSLKVGDMWEISAEMSARRAAKNGVDPVKEKMYREYEKEYGEKHPDVVREEKRRAANERLKALGIKIAA